jgi:hypothetical protein
VNGSLAKRKEKKSHTGRHAADDDLKRRIKDGGQTRQKHGDAKPLTPLEARRLR